MLSVVKSTRQPGIELLETPRPTLAPGEALVRVAAAGICGSDLSIAAWKESYEWMRLPLVLGHEVAGVVEAVADGEGRALIGAQVVINPYISCGRCAYCRTGLDQLCEWGEPATESAPRALQIGFRRPGGMAQWVAVPYQNLFRLPHGMEFEVAGVFEPFVVSLHASRRLISRAPKTVLVLGPGPIGLNALIALKAISDAEVWMVGTARDEPRLRRAAELGATRTFVVGEGLEEELRDASDGLGVDATLDATGDPGAVLQASSLTRKGGDIVLVGINHADTAYPFSRLVRRELSISGVYGAPAAAWREAFALWERGAVAPERLVTHSFPLAEAVAAFQTARQADSLKVLLVAHGESGSE